VRLSGIDANLLAALDALLREKSVMKGRNYVLTDEAEKLAGMVANATRALADVFEEPPKFDAATSSIVLPSYKFSQIWRNSHNDDPAHMWLRERIASICQRREIALTGT
jgi:hypothetical protein